MEYIISVHAGYDIDYLIKDIESVSSKLKIVKPHNKSYSLRATTRSHILAKLVVAEFVGVGVSFSFETAG